MQINDVFEIMQKNLDHLKFKYRVRSIGVFGSYEVNLETDGSDIDVLVEFEEGFETFDNYMDLKFYLQDIYQKKSISS